MEKKFLREEFLKKRVELTAAEAALKSEQIRHQISGLLNTQVFRTIHIFLPHPSKNEVDTWQLAHGIWQHSQDIRLVAPYVIPGTREMLHFVLTPEAQLVPNRWKIPEPDPQTSEEVDIQSIDAILVPLLAFDRFGYRVGYGGGYYDRFLKDCRPNACKIGVSFFGPVARIDDLDAFDVPLDLCITPNEVFYFETKNADNPL